MMKNTLQNKALTNKIAAVATLGFFTIVGATTSPSAANAQIDMANKPVLVITNKAMPSARSAPSAVYSSPARAREITPQEVTLSPYMEQSETVVGQKVKGLNKELFTVQSRIERLSTQLTATETRGRSMAAEYYSSVATINTQLQTGTTPGNPRLVNKLNVAQKNLETLSANIANLNSLSVEVADTASKASYLLDTVRSTYNLSGAVEEDHQHLAQLEDQINASIVNVSRLQSSVSDDITRTTAYLTSERSNLRTLALAVSNGDLYGQSLASQTFSPATLQQASFSGNSSMSAPMQKRLLAKIRFDKANVNFEQPVYAAVQSALQKHPNSKFELVAVHPTTGNTAQVAIESTKARRNAEKVLRSLTQMGLSLDKIDLSYSPSSEANTNEVHVFVR